VPTYGVAIDIHTHKAGRPTQGARPRASQQHHSHIPMTTMRNASHSPPLQPTSRHLQPRRKTQANRREPNSYLTSLLSLLPCNAPTPPTIDLVPPQLDLDSLVPPEPWLHYTNRCQPYVPKGRHVESGTCRCNLPWPLKIRVV
jgi:hypothetical protein